MNLPDLLLLGPASPAEAARLAGAFRVHETAAPPPDLAARVCAIASLDPPGPLDARFLQQFPRLKIVASFGVGYDHVDARWAAAHAITVTHTPDVLTEETADIAFGLLLCTVRELPQAMAYLKAGHWPQAPYPLTAASLRDRTVGMLGMGRIGQAIGRRLEASGVPVVYHARRPNPAVPYRHYPDLKEMCRAVDTLIVIVPGGTATRHLVDRAVLDALGANGILINVARGSVVDEQALIAALRERRLLAAGLDVFEHEPRVPQALIDLPNAVLLPHVGSASRHTRGRMEALVIDNLLAWAAGRAPLTPVPETPAAP